MIVSGLTVAELVPGDVCEAVPGRAGVFVGLIEPHPVWSSLSMVVWQMGDGSTVLDALNPAQVLGADIDRADDHGERIARLRSALTS